MAGPSISLRDIIQWDVRSWSRILPLWEAHIPPDRPLTALGIGEREGGLSLWLASKGIEVVCTDLHEFPKATTDLHRRHGVSERVSYSQADATRLPFQDKRFDLVFFKSVIGALGTKEKQMKAIAEMHRVLVPGGRLLFAENLHGSPLHQKLRQRFVAWQHYWRYLDPVDDRDLFAQFPEFVDRTAGAIANLGRTEAQRDQLARADDLIIRVIPKRWRTIWYGVATKQTR